MGNGYRAAFQHFFRVAIAPADTDGGNLVFCRADNIEGSIADHNCVFLGANLIQKVRDDSRLAVSACVHCSAADDFEVAAQIEFFKNFHGHGFGFGCGHKETVTLGNQENNAC